MSPVTGPIKLQFQGEQNWDFPNKIFEKILVEGDQIDLPIPIIQSTKIDLFAFIIFFEIAKKLIIHSLKQYRNK
jgi:hypothetical protein